LYTTRLMLVVFWGEMKTPMARYPEGLMTVPLLILAVLSIVAGFIEWPHNLIHLTLFSDLVQQVLPGTSVRSGLPAELTAQIVATAATLGGIYTGYVLYYRKTSVIEGWKGSPVMMGVRQFLYKGWAFDDLYHALFVRPFLYLTRINKSDILDRAYTGIAAGSRQLNRWFSLSQNGSARWYIAGVLIGVLFILTLQLLL
jgi:NADH-quinone oxidoreductase subunit L